MNNYQSQLSISTFVPVRRRDGDSRYPDVFHQRRGRRHYSGPRPLGARARVLHALPVGGDAIFIWNYPKFLCRIHGSGSLSKTPGNTPKDAENSTQTAQAQTAQTAQNRPNSPKIAQIRPKCLKKHRIFRPSGFALNAERMPA